jgi:DNA-binding response OmpR family regulator
VTTSRGPPYRILIVDDDAISASIHAAVLERAGFTVLIRETADIESLDSDPHLLILDLYMPSADVWERLPALRRHPVLARVPIVMLSSEESRVVHEDLLMLGADDFLVKPIAPQTLIDRVTYWIDRRYPRTTEV